jgi:hypothetical protein
VWHRTAPSRAKTSTKAIQRNYRSESATAAAAVGLLLVTVIVTVERLVERRNSVFLKILAVHNAAIFHIYSTTSLRDSLRERLD